MATVYLSSAYLAPVQYYCKLFSFESAVIEAAENYQKQSYRNRCVIAVSNGVQTLTVPVEKPQTEKYPTKEMRISEHGHWRHIHWNALVSAYGMSPFFEYYEDDFAPFYEQKFEFLFDFNQALQELICNLLDIHPKLSVSSCYEVAVPNDFRNNIHPRHAEADDTFHPHPYYQVFREKYGFIPNLSIVDLLFNMGPEAVLTLRECTN
ncbi:MAG: WbqC family protein [Tannerella sp.]|jgi:hypothetical protein|nr:WbqC family protein [Tannerella sp.]